MVNTETKHRVLLLIEDNPLLTGMYKTAFEKEGVKVLFAHNGEAGIQLAKEKKPAVVLLDLLMPGIDGLEVLRRLKADTETSSITVLILTIVSDKEKREQAKIFGAADYLLKSELALHEIVKRVMQYLAA